MASYDDFLKNFETAAEALIKKDYGDFASQAKSDVDSFMQGAKTDLQNWTKMLVQGGVSKEEFESLVQGDSDLLELHMLKQSGLAAARADTLKNDLINLTVSTAINTFLP